jgi:hypothetical protein
MLCICVDSRLFTGKQEQNYDALTRRGLALTRLMLIQYEAKVFTAPTALLLQRIRTNTGQMLLGATWACLIWMALHVRRGMCGEISS